MSGVLHGVVVSLKAAAAAATDTFFRYVSLLLNTTSTNGAQNNTFLDASTNNFTITRNGNTTQGSFTPYMPNGYWGAYFDGAGDYLIAPTNAAFDFGSGDFTVELWFYSLIANSNYQRIFGINAGGTIPTESVVFEIDASGVKLGAVNGTTYYGATTSTQLAPNTWHHLALVRNGNTVTGYINGVSAGSSTMTVAVNFATGAFPQIGAWLQSGAYSRFINGYISNVRLVKGTAVYTGNFTPPTTPLTAITNTSLLACQSNRFIDNSSNAFAITVNGDTRISKFSPFNPSASYDTATYGGSGYFDGSGDYLTVPTTTTLSFGTGDFTVEAWVYKTTAANASIIDGRVDPGAAAPWALFVDASNFPYFYDGSVYTSSIAILLNAWNHVVVVRTSGTLKLFVNGVQGYSAAVATNLDRSAGAFIGVAANTATPTAYWVGYISNLRIVKGTAVYTANFTPPSTPLTAITNTSLLLNFTNGGIYDAATINDAETVGNAQVSTTVAKFGTTSMAFDGTGDWLTVLDKPELRFGTAPFTIEGWFYLSATGAVRGLVAKGTATTGWLLSLNASNQVVFTDTSTSFNSTGTLAATTWTYIAVVREGTGANQTKIYINGTNDGTGTSSTNFTGTDVMYVGANRTGASEFNGYIDELRITNGVARYTTNFTPPTAAFPTQ